MLLLLLMMMMMMMMMMVMLPHDHITHPVPLLSALLSHDIATMTTQVVIGEAKDGCVENRGILEAFMAEHPQWTFDTRAIGKEINADVSICLNIKELGRAASVKFHAQPIEQVVAFEKSQGLC